MRSYPHMCRDEHIEIGHADSGDDERCPLCRAKDHIEVLKEAIAWVRTVHPRKDRHGNCEFVIAQCEWDRLVEASK